MDKQSQIAFFDQIAGEWDASYPYDPVRLRTLAALCDLKEGARIINCACGTAPMTPYLLEYRPSRLLAVDFAPKMVELARKRSDDPCFEVDCRDIMEVSETEFDLAIVCNAFQFFENRGSLVRQLHHLLAPGGRIMICCPKGRSEVNSHYQASAAQLALPLPTAQTLAKSSMNPYFDVDIMVDSPALYAVSGIIRPFRGN